MGEYAQGQHLRHGKAPLFPGKGMPYMLRARSGVVDLSPVFDRIDIVGMIRGKAADG
jgi:hypothetical protein